ncbi:MAG: STAS domain-containing protein [Actinomycetota bacterium]|nr:STAS domain-containing protein [Actinomycetota bacterium]
MTLNLTVDTTTHSATVRLAGDLDFTTTGEFVTAIHRLLDEHPGLRRLHLDCAGLSFCDSAGLSGLLLVHRRTCADGLELHLDHRPAQLDRVLDVTGVLEHLTCPAADADEPPVTAAEAPDETVG